MNDYWLREENLWTETKPTKTLHWEQTEFDDFLQDIEL